MIRPTIVRTKKSLSGENIINMVIQRLQRLQRLDTQSTITKYGNEVTIEGFRHISNINDYFRTKIDKL